MYQRVSKWSDWDGGDRRRSRLGKKDDEFGFGHIVCEMAVRYPAKDISRLSEV